MFAEPDPQREAEAEYGHYDGKLYAETGRTFFMTIDEYEGGIGTLATRAFTRSYFHKKFEMEGEGNGNGVHLLPGRLGSNSGIRNSTVPITGPRRVNDGQVGANTGTALTIAAMIGCLVYGSKLVALMMGGAA